MDVRCEQCGTEYELDGAKLKPAGVTVKCSECGHLFKVRRRRPTSLGHEAPLQAGRSTAPNESEEDGKEERVWMIRLEGGEIWTCEELATLQKWIVAGDVSRQCEISRTGRKWKTLGEITELNSFFEIGDEVAKKRARSRADASDQLAATASAPSPEPAPVPQSQRLTAPRPVIGPSDVPPAVGVGNAPPGATIKARSQSRLSSASPDDKKTANWAIAGRVGEALSDEAASGPTGGLARGVPVDDVAFVSERSRRSLASGSGGADSDLDRRDPNESDWAPPKSNIGKWIVLASLLIIGGAGLMVWFKVYYQPGNTSAGGTTGEVDGGSGAVATDPDAAADAAPDLVPPETQELLANAMELATQAIHANTADALEELAPALQELVAANPDSPDGEVQVDALVARARVEVALAELSLDSARASPENAAERKKTARNLASSAYAIAKRAHQLAPQNADALVVLADAQRIRDRRTTEIENWIERALRIDNRHRGAYLSRALVLLRDERTREARALLEELEKGDSDDVRPTYRLALLDLAEEQVASARVRVEKILARQPTHIGAQTLLARLDGTGGDDGNPVDPNDPMPPELTDGGTETAGDGDGDGDGDHESVSYDQLVERADRLAENGNCPSALKLYERAFNQKPSGVEALTGLGYCYLDGRRFDSAIARFRAALGVSSRYKPAMWGLAETYQRMGDKDAAVAAYRRFLEAHPNDRRAQAAERMIERLGGAGAPDSGETGSSEGEDGGGESDSGGSDSGGSGSSDSGSAENGGSAGGTSSSESAPDAPTGEP